MKDKHACNRLGTINSDFKGAQLLVMTANMFLMRINQIESDQ